MSRIIHSHQDTLEDPNLPDDEELDGDEESAKDDDAPQDESSNGADDVLGLYLRQMGAIRLLKSDEERAIAERWKKPAIAFAMPL